MFIIFCLEFLGALAIIIISLPKLNVLALALVVFELFMSLIKLIFLKIKPSEWLILK